MSHGFEQALAGALEAPYGIPAGQLAGMLACTEAGFAADLFAAARTLRDRLGKGTVLPRGLIEVSNVCAKDCLYCGIRRSRADLPRYRLSEEEVLACCDEARRRGYPAVAFQSGEIESAANTAFYERILRKISPTLEVTLSLGEQSEETYRRWRAAAGAGILRYLIRIETGNRTLYGKIHPASASFDRRLACVRTLKRLGYVTGSGVMIGLPGQTDDDLARDIVLFRDLKLDMVGMGPFIPDPHTPLGLACADESAAVGRARFEKALRMIALVRLYLHDVNIVAATALDALDPQGCAKGIASGANVVMPNLTPPCIRANYALYPGKVTGFSMNGALKTLR